jgi:hypothetical protein
MFRRRATDARSQRIAKRRSRLRSGLHDQAYQRAAAELLKRQKERRLTEIGFVSQKRAAAVS